MKNNNNYKLLFTILMLTGLFACGKEETIKSEVTKTAKVTITSIAEREGGDDDEDPVIQGIILNALSETVSSATVELIPKNGIEFVDVDLTDNDGQFSLVGETGSYFIKVILEGGTTVITEDFSLTENISITIEI